jgi:acyl-CoA oxidase
VSLSPSAAAVSVGTTTQHTSAVHCAVLCAAVCVRVLLLCADSVFSSTLDDVTRDWREMRKYTMARIVRLLQYQRTDDPSTFAMREEAVGWIDPALSTRMYAHFGLFANAIRGTGTPEQAERFRSLVDSGSGGFAMTELGRGSFIQGMETTATFDPARDVFVVNSPTITSTKWWIATIANTALHLAVFARLIVGGRDYGVHTFIVPIRDPRDFAVLEGVRCGDCGPKMGRNGVDNGHVRFTVSINTRKGVCG